MEELARRLDVPVDYIDLIRIDEGDEFEPAYWEETEREKGYIHTDWELVTVDDP